MRTMQLAVAGLVALGATVVGAGRAEAQAAVASPFHAGQWGIEGYAAAPMGGVTRFFTPRTALVLALSAERLSTSSDDPASSLRSNKGTVLDATLGLRRHSMIAPRIAGTIGAGVVGGTVHQKIEYSGTFGPSGGNSSYFGAYADFGGQYMVADHFAVGLAYRLTARHLKNGFQEQSGSEFTSSFLPIRATLYF
jgi:hypothetical protein